ncbi:MAG: LysE family transporter [Solirubrobacteraceae bacterium]
MSSPRTCNGERWRRAPHIGMACSAISAIQRWAAFFTSLLPQFAPAHHPAFWTMLILGLVFCALTLAWLVTYAIAVSKARDVLTRPRIRRTIEGITGCVLIGLGIRLATESR